MWPQAVCVKLYLTENYCINLTVVHEAGWTPEPGWKLQRRKKYLDLASIQTPDHLAQRLVTVLTTLYRLNTWVYQKVPRLSSTDRKQMALGEYLR